MTDFETPRKRPSRGRVSVVGVLGELFITGGVLVLLFLGWQLWLNDIIVGAEQRDEAILLSEQWEKGEAVAPTKDAEIAPGDPVVMAEPADAVTFANLIVPRLNDKYMRTISEGVGTNVLNSNKRGIGHYPGTQMPGEVGNFVLAAHRSAFGGAFHELHSLQLGDPIYVETDAGWYKYIFRGLEYVKPTGVGVLEPVPQMPGAAPTDRIITLTTCNPFFSTAERIIAYGVFDTWYPRDGGIPPEIATISLAGGN